MPSVVRAQSDGAIAPSMMDYGLIGGVALVAVGVFIILYRRQRKTISALRKEHDSLRQSAEKYRLLTENIKDVVWVLDAESMRFIYVSPSVEPLRGYTPEEIMAVPFTEALTPEVAKEYTKLVRHRANELRNGNRSWEAYETNQVEQPCKDGSSVWTEVITNYYINPKNDRVEILGVTREITEQRKAQDEIKRLALTDQLTGLANRNQFHQKFDDHIKLARREGFKLALVLLDLDHFKPVNDTYGHQAGDMLLQKAAAIFKKHCRETDLVSRIGGDEFSILLVNPDSQESVNTVAQRIIDEISQPVEIAGNNVRVGVSIGIATYPSDATEEEALFHIADTNLYAAKEKGRNTYCFNETPPSDS